MHLGTRGFAATFFLLVSAQAAAAAVSIQYSVVPVGGNIYRYVYSITNTSGSPAVQLFEVLFDTSLYQEASLQIVTPAPLSSQWTQLILHSVPPAFPAAYDALALVGGIPAGATVTGFSVQFVWLGAGLPASQPFQIYDISTFNIIGSGFTSQAPNPIIPAASTLSLSLLGVALAVAVGLQTRLRAAKAIRSRSPGRW